MNEFNPDRIDVAIACRGWTKKELAGRCGMAPARITDITRGRTAFTESMAERLAFATGFPVGFFLMPDVRVPERQLTFRRLRRMRKPLFDRLVTEFSLLLDAVRRVSGMSAGLTDGRWLDAISPDVPPSAADIERIAMEVRSYWGVPTHGPVRDVTRSAEKSGIVVAPLAVPIEDASGDGVTRPSVPDAAPVIGYLPRGKTGDRLRFTVAHELGHLVLHRFRTPSDAGMTEREAHAFAGALLMPEEDARAVLSPDMSLRDYAAVKAGWGVSIAALVSRACRLGIIDYDRQKSLRIQMANRHWNRKEPVEVGIEHPVLFKQMVGNSFGDFSDYRNPTVSRGTLTGLLGLPFDLVNTWCADGLIAE